MVMSFKFWAGQDLVSPYYTNHSEAFIELVSPEKLAVRVIEGGAPAKDIQASPTSARVTNVRVPAGHWIVLSRDSADQELEVRMRRLAGGSGALTSPTEIVYDAAFSVSAGETVDLVRNDLLRPMSYRLIVRGGKPDKILAFHVQSGTDKITPTSTHFVLDTVVPSGGILGIRVTEGTLLGNYDLQVDP
jgi:hypothetical protein